MRVPEHTARAVKSRDPIVSWHCYPGHVVKVLVRGGRISDAFGKSVRYASLHEGGILVYETPDLEDRVTAHFALERATTPQRKTCKDPSNYQPASAFVAWLLSFDEYAAKGVHHGREPYQVDVLRFLADVEDPEAFHVHVVPRVFPDMREHLEKMVNDDLATPMRLDRVRVWTHPRNNPEALAWNQLEDVFVRWFRYSLETEPPVGARVDLANLERVGIQTGRKWAMYCEIDLTHGRQETVEALLAMLGTYSETVFPLEFVLFA